MTVKYIQSRRHAYVKESLDHMVDWIDSVVDKGYVNWDQEVANLYKNKDSHDKFSVAYQMYWSLITYVENLRDMQKQ